MQLFFLLIFSVLNLGYAQCGKAMKVSDGDTFVILLNDNQQLKVRLAFIDCPEHDQPFGSEAKSFSNNYLINKTVCLNIKYYDPYKRAVSIVKLPGGKILNEELLKAGMAWHFKKFSKDHYYALLETTAKNQHIGLWKTMSPQPPWEFRKLHKRGFLK